MTAITRVDIRVMTGERPYIESAASGGDLYLGLCGREFFLELSEDDAQPGPERLYILGAGANVKDAEYNDPRDPPLDTADLDQFPKYIYFESTDSDPAWDLEHITMTVNPDAAPIAYTARAGDQAPWLSRGYGKACYLYELELAA